MGLLDNIAGAAGGLFGGSSGQHAGLVSALLQMFSNNQHGGINGIINSFNQNGLGNIISSWIGRGENLPVSQDQVKQGFGNERIQYLSEQTGQSPESITSGLTQILPTVFDKLTPEGSVPQGGLLEKGISFLKSKI
ncbi:MAG: YidB family protein [Bacillota bacterium]